MKFFVEDVYDESADPDAELSEGDTPTFFVTVVPYIDRDDMGAGADELDPGQWADMVQQYSLKQTGIEPRD